MLSRYKQRRLFPAPSFPPDKVWAGLFFNDIGFSCWDWFDPVYREVCSAINMGEPVPLAKYLAYLNEVVRVAGLHGLSLRIVYPHGGLPYVEGQGVEHR